MGVNFFADELRPSADIGCSVNKQLMIWLSKLKWWWPNDHPTSKFVSSPHVCMEWTCLGCLMISGFNTPFRHEVRVNLIINSDSFTVMWRCTPTQQFSSNVVNPVTSLPPPQPPPFRPATWTIGGEFMRVVTNVVLIHCFTCGTELLVVWTWQAVNVWCDHGNCMRLAKIAIRKITRSCETIDQSVNFYLQSAELHRRNVSFMSSLELPHVCFPLYNWSFSNSQFTTQDETSSSSFCQVYPPCSLTESEKDGCMSGPECFDEWWRPSLELADREDSVFLKNRCGGLVIITRTISLHRGYTHSFCLTVFNQKWMSSCNCAQELTTVGRAVSQKIQLCHGLMLQYDEKADKRSTMLQ